MVYIAWNSYQRRAESLAKIFNLKLKYIYFPWEHKFFLAKLWSFVLKIITTSSFLLREKPDIIFIQLPPTILLYNVYLYSILFNKKIVADCHNTMIYDDHWIKWPFAKNILRKIDIVVVHNEQLLQHTSKLFIDAQVLKDPIPEIGQDCEAIILEKLNIDSLKYIIVPCSFQADEPFEALLGAMKNYPDIKFVLTWYKDIFYKRNGSLEIPENLIFSDFLPEKEYNALFKNAFGSLILTTRVGTQPSGASEAISLGVPMVMSDIDTTRALYENCAVLIENTSKGIASGIEELTENREYYAKKTLELKNKLNRNYKNEMSDFTKLIQKV